MAHYIIAKDEADWQRIRMSGLGGSDVGSVLGMNAYKSAFELWEEKLIGTPLKDLSDNIAIQFGNIAEDFVASLFEKETGFKVQKDNKTYKHEKYPFLLANIDRKIVGQKAILECKTTSVYNAKQWDGDNVPDSYLLQVQHYLNVLDYDVAYIAVLIGNTTFKYKKIERDQELIDLIMPKLIEFWTVNVLEKQPPIVDGSASCSHYIKEKYQYVVDDMLEIDLPKQCIDACELVVNYKNLINDTTTLMKEQENIIKKYMGDNKAAKAIGKQFKINWAFQDYSRVDTAKLKEKFPLVYQECLKTTKNRVFRLKEISE